MGKWLKVTGREPMIGWARKVSHRYSAYRGGFEGGFYAVFAESHLPATVKGFKSWKLRVEELGGPPQRRKRSAPPAQTNGSITTARRPNRPAIRRRRREESEDAEESIEMFGTTVADIRTLAFDHSKGEVAFLLGVSTGELNQAFLELDTEPIYFGYKCKSCDLSFQGEDALSLFRAHLLLCHRQSN